MRTIIVLCKDDLVDEVAEAVEESGDNVYVYTTLDEAVSKTLLLTNLDLILIQRVFLTNDDVSPLTCQGNNTQFTDLEDLEEKLK